MIVCVYNRPDQVVRCLDSLVAQDYPNFEIVVVDDGSTDDTADVVKRYACEHPETTVRIASNPANLGVSGARNVGILAATGHFVFFIDSDCTAEPEWLTSMVSELVRSGAAAVAGVVVDRAPSNLAEWAALGSTRLVSNSVQRRRLVGGNMGFRRAVLLETGFDPGLRYGADEDDLARRLARAGHQFAFASEAVVHHDHPMTTRKYLRQAWAQGQGSAYYWWKHAVYVGRDIVFLTLTIITLPLIVFGVPFALVPGACFVLHVLSHLYSERFLKGKSWPRCLYVLPLVLLHNLVKTASVAWWWIVSTYSRLRRVVLRPSTATGANSEGVPPGVPGQRS
ncbi:MAG: glycosyltransferase [Thermoguttaceae bacterium]|nr:glycosyltransferase [Thermoguttaceae bacterium]